MIFWIDTFISWTPLWEEIYVDKILQAKFRKESSQRDNNMSLNLYVENLYIEHGEII